MENEKRRGKIKKNKLGNITKKKLFTKLIMTYLNRGPPVNKFCRAYLLIADFALALLLFHISFFY